MCEFNIQEEEEEEGEESMKIGNVSDDVFVKEDDIFLDKFSNSSWSRGDCLEKEGNSVLNRMNMQLSRAL